jgi:hypothetical protein
VIVDPADSGLGRGPDVSGGGFQDWAPRSVAARALLNWLGSVGFKIAPVQIVACLIASRPDAAPAPSMAVALKATGLPVVDVAAALPEWVFPRVATDSAAVPRLAAGHLRERGLSHFGCGRSPCSRSARVSSIPNTSAWPSGEKRA